MGKGRKMNAETDDAPPSCPKYKRDAVAAEILRILRNVPIVGYRNENDELVLPDDKEKP